MSLLSKIKNSKAFTAAIVFALLFVNFASINSVAALGHASDTLSLSWPSTNVNHTIKFKTTKSIPPAGIIRVQFEPGDFFIQSGFDFSDMDLSTSATENGTYTDRLLSASSSPGHDVVSATASSSVGIIDISLSTSTGISVDTYVQIEIGTQASFGSVGDKQVRNPSSLGSYRVEVYTYNESNAYLERAIMLVAIVDPITMGGFIPKQRANGKPSGVLSYSTTQSLMSLDSNYVANCRWSNASGTAYSAMTNDFSNTGSYYHSTTITGLSNGQTYTYYVRCRDAFSVDDTSDFIITFQISGFEGEGGDDDEEGSSGSEGGGAGTGGGGGGGSGPSEGPGSGDLQPYPPDPGSPAVSFSGWAYPGSEVFLLKDGVEESQVNANSSGAFSVSISEIEQGVYTFGLWAKDNSNRKSAVQSFTFYIEEGTKTAINDIFLPPSIEAVDNGVEIGENFEFVGQSAASANIELWFYPKKVGGVLDSEIIKANGVATASGDWRFFIDTSDMTGGLYLAKARATLGASVSEFSNIEEVMVGGELPEQTCSGADLNGDTKVNITDFSILLYWWTTDNDCADQNDDGTVNLIDFSIMMFYWTG